MQKPRSSGATLVLIRGAPPESVRSDNATSALAEPAAARHDAYRGLVERNRALAAQTWGTRYEHVVFHEHALPREHAEYVRRQTPTLALRFVAVGRYFETRLARVPPVPRACASWHRGSCCAYAASGNRSYWPPSYWLSGHAAACPATDASRRHGCGLHASPPGYKAMCSFWYGGFLRYLPNRYEHALRIDDDCVLDPRQPDRAERLLRSDADIAASIWTWGDRADVVRGLAPFFTALSRRAEAPSGACTRPFEPPAEWASPYTNVLWLRLSWARRMQWAIDAVHQSECILSGRWGDLPLWGATARLGGRPASLKLAYVHGSHSGHVVDPANRSGGVRSGVRARFRGYSSQLEGGFVLEM